MAEKKKELLETGQAKMQTLVDQYNELTKELTSLQARLSEVQTAIVKQQGYLECLSDIDGKN